MHLESGIIRPNKLKIQKRRLVMARLLQALLD